MGGIAVVTGASSGIGAEYARQLAAQGFDIVAIGRRKDRLDQLAVDLSGAHGVEVEGLVLDLTDSAGLTQLAERLAGDVPDLLVNNAGVAHYMPFADLPAERARELIDANITAPMLLTRAVLPGMLQRDSGSIINVASLLAFSGATTGPAMPQRAVYAGTKSFIVTFTRIVAAEVAESKLRVQVVCPGVVSTEFHSRQGLDLSAVPRMQPAQVVTASLLDLADGTVVSIPALADESAIEMLDAANAGLTKWSRATELPPRYTR